MAQRDELMENRRRATENLYANHEKQSRRGTRLALKFVQMVADYLLIQQAAAQCDWLSVVFS